MLSDFKNLPKSAPIEPPPPEETLFVELAKFEEMGHKLQTQNIAEKHRIKDTIFYMGQEYVLTGAHGTSTGYGWRQIEGYSVIDKTNYKGALEPKPYREHHWAVNNNRREGGYTGMLVPFGKRQLVLLEKFKFKPIEIETGQQMTLF